MARISGVNIPTGKKIHIALTYIFGIGSKIANDLCDQASIDKTKRVNQLNDDELNNTYWEIETGEFFTGEQIKELEERRNNLISKLIIKENSKQDSVLKIIMGFCETYEKLCQKKYPEAPLPLEILKSVN